MADKALPSPELLRQLLRYDPETGKLFWLPRPAEMFPTIGSWKIWMTRFCDQEALISLTFDGYRYGGILGKKQYAHRVIWAMSTDKWPDADIDHVSGDRADNRLANLRAASRSENLRNTGARPHNKLGIKGVCRVKSGKYRAEIKGGGKKIHLGSFDTAEEASAAYKKAAARLHGEFARFD